MPGPAPKDPSTRARRNKTSTRATLKQGDRAVPPMPAGPDWHAEAIRWWNDVWSSPMSPEWDDSDIHNVVLCAMYYNDVWTADSARERKDAGAEFRMHRKDLGLTPLDRRRLEWTIESADEAKDRGRQRRGRKATPAETGADPRDVLRAVN